MVLKGVLFGVLFSFALQISGQVWDFKSTDFSLANERAKQNYGASLDNLPQLANNLTIGLDTDVERFRAIYLWVCQNVKNDYRLYYKNKRKRKRFKNDSLKLEKWNNKFKKEIFSKLLRRKRTICTGYAYMVKTLCDLVDIPSQIVDGFGKTALTTMAELTTPNHSWNAVKLNNKWYLCDPTWSSGTQNPKNGKFEFNYNDGLFLVNPKLFAMSHYPQNPNWLLINDNIPTFTDFINAPILYGQSYNLLAEHKTPQKLHNEVEKNYVISFSFKLRPGISPDNLVLLIDNGIENKTVNLDFDISDKDLKMNHTLEKRGFYDIHLMIDNQLIATYVYKVNKKLSVN